MNCPACQTPYNPGNRFCGRCGAELPAVSAEPPAYPPPTEPPPASPFPPYAPSPEFSPAADMPAAFRRQAFLYTVLRLLAYIIDAFIITVPLVVLWALFGLPMPTETDELLNPPPGFGWLQVLNFSLAMVYETAFITLYAATVGKRLFGMYVVRTDGTRVGWGRALARYLLKVLLANFAVITLGLVFLAVILMIALRPDKRGLHDLICDTVVLRRDRRDG